VTITEFRRIEEALAYILALEFGQEDNELTDDCNADLRRYLRDHNVKIEGMDQYTVEPQYPSTIALVAKKNNAVVGQLKRARESEA
jgi:hypothetical protein